MRLLATLSSLLVAAGALAGDWLGARECRTCHEAQYAQWQKTPHARAHELLSESESRDPRCTSCHSTAAADGLVGVQCESCHGAGRHYWPEPVMRDVELAKAVGLTGGGDATTCRRCHREDAPRVTPFDLAAALEKVRHR